MPKYEVIIKECETYIIELEAENEQNARDKAWTIAEDPKELQKYHNDSDGDVEVWEL